MHNGTALEGRLARLFVERLNTEVPTADTDLFETGLLDSLRFVEFLAALETDFGIGVAVEELQIDAFRSLSRIAAFVRAKQGLTIRE